MPENEKTGKKSFHPHRGRGAAEGSARAQHSPHCSLGRAAFLASLCLQELCSSHWGWGTRDRGNFSFYQQVKPKKPRPGCRGRQQGVGQAAYIQGRLLENDGLGVGDGASRRCQGMPAMSPTASAAWLLASSWQEARHCLIQTSDFAA